MKKTNWVVMKTFSYQSSASPAAIQDQIVYSHRIIDNFRLLEVSVDAPFFSNSNFTSSYFFIGFSFSTSTTVNGNFYRDVGVGSIVNVTYTNNIFGIYNKGKDRPLNVSLGNAGVITPYQKFSFTVSLPLGSDGNVIADKYKVQAYVRMSHKLNNTNDTLLDFPPYTYEFSTKRNDLLLMSTNNKGIICYDIDNSFRNLDNKFLYLTFTQTNADIKTLDRVVGSQDVYVGAESVYRQARC
jgi:hypothetical protein